MKGLTLTEPWASLMALGAKKFETRSWSTKYRGLVAIHAAKGFPAEARRLCRTKPFSNHVSIESCIKTRAHIIAVGELIDVAPTLGEYSPAFSLSEEFYFGDYTLGRFIWCFKGMKRLTTPIPYTGMLGLWNVPEETEALIKDDALKLIPKE